MLKTAAGCRRGQVTTSRRLLGKALRGTDLKLVFRISSISSKWQESEDLQKRTASASITFIQIILTRAGDVRKPLSRLHLPSDFAKFLAGASVIKTLVITWPVYLRRISIRHRLSCFPHWSDPPFEGLHCVLGWGRKSLTFAWFGK